MTDYFVKNTGGIAFVNGGNGTVFDERITIANLLNDSTTFVDSSGNALTVPATGFSDDDTIQWLLPKGTYLAAEGCVVVHTAEGGVATAFLGCTGNTDAFFATGEIDLNSITTQELVTAVGTGHVALNATTYLILEFDTDLTAVCDFSIMLMGGFVDTGKTSGLGA